MAAERVRSWLDLASSAALSIAALALLSSVGSRLFLGPGVNANSGSQGRVEVIEATISRTDVSKSLGTGRVAVVEFSDFQCPYCGMFARDTFPQLKTELVDAGVVEFVFFHYPLREIHSLAYGASRAAECAANQDRFWEMRQRLFRSGASLESPQLLIEATAANVDIERFERCVAEQGETQVDRDIEVGRRLGVDATPALFVGFVDSSNNLVLRRKMRGSVSYRQIKGVIDALPDVAKTF